MFLSQLTRLSPSPFFFFFNDTATTEIYTLSLHDALPISCASAQPGGRSGTRRARWRRRSEEHTSELQSRGQLVCRLLLEKKKPTGKAADFKNELTKRAGVDTIGSVS